MLDSANFVDFETLARQDAVSSLCSELGLAVLFGKGCIISARRHLTALSSATRFIAEPLERRMLLSLAPAGPEFRVNSFTIDHQSASAIGVDADGDFVVAWTSVGQDGYGDGVYAQRYNSAGGQQGGEFRVNSFTTYYQRAPAIGMDADGDFVVAWENSEPSSGSVVYAQRYNAAGVPQGGEFRVNTFTTGNQYQPAIGMDADGDFVVAWESFDGSESGIYAQRFDAAGVAQGAEFRVNSYIEDHQGSPAVAMDADGDFVVAWHSDQDYTYYVSDFDINAQRYNAAGVPQGAEFRVNSFTTDNQTNPAVGTDADGDFVVAWHSGGYGQVHGEIYAQRYNAAGVPRGAEFRVNSFITGSQGFPAIATDVDGDFVVAWDSNLQDGSAYGIYAQAYNAAGAAQGAEFKVNTFTTGWQRVPAIGMDADGDCVIAWSGNGTGDPSGVYAQRYTDVPVIAGVFVNNTRAVPYGVAPGPAAQIVVGFSEDVLANGPNGVTNAANWRVTHHDGTTTSSVPINGISYGFNAAANGFEATLGLSGSFASGNLQITALDDIRDVAGNALDGNFDRSPGGSFALTFGIGAYGPSGNEIRVNSAAQGSPAIGVDADGDFVVAWESRNQGGSERNIHAQRYTAAGVPQGAEFRVNSFTTDQQRFAAIGMDADGDFVVAWQSIYQEGSFFHNYGIYAQRYNAAGVPQGEELNVNTYTTNSQALPSIAMDADGDFVVAWQSSYQDGSKFGIYAQRYNAAGVPQGAEFRVNTVATNEQSMPAIAVHADGDFVVAWTSVDQDGSGSGVYAQRYNAAGVRQGFEFRVNSFTTFNQREPAIGMDADGDFVVAWSSAGQDGSSSGVYAQRYNAAGVPQGGEFQVNSFTTDRQVSPAIAVDAGGDFVIAWQSGGEFSHDVYSQRYDAAGTPQGAEFRVNGFTFGDQTAPAVAMDADGDFVVAWYSRGAYGTGFGIYAQRYNLGVPPTVASLSDSPDPVSPGATVTLTAGGVSDDGSVTRVHFYRETNGVAGLQFGAEGDTRVATATGPAQPGVWIVQIPTAGLAPGTHAYWAQATDDAGFVGAPAATTNTIIPGKPAVTNSSFNFATLPQRLAFTFDQNVGPSLGLDDILVQQLPGGPTVTPDAVSFDTATNSATFTFNTAIPDGRYRARLIASGISGPGGSLPADHFFEFTFLRGDANGDAAVNLADFNILATHFGQSPRNFTQGDFSYNGVVNLEDFNILASRFGTVLGPGGVATRTGGERLPGARGGAGPFETGLIGGGVRDESDDDEQLVA